MHAIVPKTPKREAEKPPLASPVKPALGHEQAMSDVLSKRLVAGRI
jgi:hypothetical protein